MIDGIDEHIARAEVEICARVEELSKEASPEVLVQLSQAVVGLKYGPQGANSHVTTHYSGGYTQKYKQSYRYKGGYTVTRHEHVYRDESRGTGFTGRAE